MPLSSDPGRALDTTPVIVAGDDPLLPAVRAAPATVTVVVRDARVATEPVDPIADPSGAARHARALAALRRADTIVVPSAAVAESVCAVLTTNPWDVLVDTGSPTARPTDRLPRRRPWRERRLAVVTPLPPEPSGVADYSARLAASLGRRCVVTCFVAGPTSREPDPARRPMGTTLAPAAELVARSERGQFDELVYVLGNQPLHGPQLALLRRLPGAVELHDVRLVGAYAALYAPGPALAAEVARLYPGRYPAGTLAKAELTMGPAQAAGVWLAREVASLATTVLVHSAHAADLVRADTGVEPAVIGPLAVPAAAPVREPAEGDEPVLVSVGVVHPSKRADLLVRALAVVVVEEPQAWLALVGPIDADYRREIDRLATELGVAGKVVITGRVDDADYDRWLSRAAAAVQLRAESNGESSAAVTDCLARGVPTVVTDDGAQAELGDDVVVKVAPDADAARLAGVITGLLADPARRRTLHHGALAHAAANGFDAAAERMLTALFGPDPD